MQVKQHDVHKIETSEMELNPEDVVEGDADMLYPNFLKHVSHEIEHVLQVTLQVLDILDNVLQVKDHCFHVSQSQFLEV